MFRFRWLSNLLGTAQSGKDSRRQSAQQHRGVRLRLEQLEDRLTPSGTAFPGMEVPVPAVQITPMMIEVQIIKQIPYFQFWNNDFMQTYGVGLPGFANTVSLMESFFPTTTNAVLNGQL